MVLTNELIHEKLKQSQYATMVTISETQLVSRTMTYGYVPGKGIFALTQKGSDKLNDVAQNSRGLFHISKIESDMNLSYDISISGNFKTCDEFSPYFNEGIQVLGENNPQILGLLNSEAKSDYEMLWFQIDEIRGYSYYQIISGLPKTIIKY